MPEDPTPRRCGFQTADGTQCEFASADLAEYGQHTDGHAVDHYNVLHTLINVREEWAAVASKAEALEFRLRTTHPEPTAGAGAGRWKLRNGKLAMIGFRYEPTRGGQPYWEGAIEGGGLGQWDDAGKDLRGYDEFDLEVRLA